MCFCLFIFLLFQTDISKMISASTIRAFFAISRTFFFDHLMKSATKLAFDVFLLTRILVLIFVLLLLFVLDSVYFSFSIIHAFQLFYTRFSCSTFVNTGLQCKLIILYQFLNTLFVPQAMNQSISQQRIRNVRSIVTCFHKSS